MKSVKELLKIDAKEAAENGKTKVNPGPGEEAGKETLTLPGAEPAPNQKSNSPHTIVVPPAQPPAVVSPPSTSGAPPEMAPPPGGDPFEIPPPPPATGGSP